MLALFETPAGFALFVVSDEGKLDKIEDLRQAFSSADSARKIVQLKAFLKFKDSEENLSAATLLIDRKPSQRLLDFLKVNCQDGETLGVADPKLGIAIKNKLQIDCVHNESIVELMRGLRSQMTELITDEAVASFTLCLSHNLSGSKLNLGPDKEDKMIVHASGVLDDLDNELKTSAMRVREWYGWHFPELSKIVPNDTLYAKAVRLMGNRVNAATGDFSKILAEEVVTELREAALVSMGFEVSEIDMMRIQDLCKQFLSCTRRRARFYDYLEGKMNAIAPNFTALVGVLVGARLIAHVGSLAELAKLPAGSLQLLGAEKALFRALPRKTKYGTPKYGLIYHAPLISKAAPKHKIKLVKSLANKSALAIRCDAVGDGKCGGIGGSYRLELEKLLSAGSAEGNPKIESYNKDFQKGASAMITTAKVYNPSGDLVFRKTPEKEEKRIPSEAEAQDTVDGEKKDKKKKKRSAAVEEKSIPSEAEAQDTADGEKKDKKKDEKKKKRSAAVEERVGMKKKKKQASEAEEVQLIEELPVVVEVGDKKRKHAEASEEETASPAKEKKKDKKKKRAD